jgi:hypothetical protein
VKNITVPVPEEIYRRARIKAAVLLYAISRSPDEQGSAS